MPEYKQLPQIHYRVNIEFEYYPELLAKWATDQAEFGYKLELNPPFQRGHVWSENQKSRFVEWMLRGGDTRPILFNHPGWMTTFKGDMVCIDGLQRSTAIVEFLEGTIPAFGAFVQDFTRKQLRQATDLTIGVLKLTKQEYLQMYLDINAGGTQHTTAELNKVREMLNDSLS